MKTVWAVLLMTILTPVSFASNPRLENFQSAALKEFGKQGDKAASFLIYGMSQEDRDFMDSELLIENLRLAFKARESSQWAKAIPEDVFLNDVLPYASLDETRESWRPEFYKICAPLVKDAKSTTEAAQILNREFFKLINVHYNTGRKAPNQSPSESRKLGMATCTGLSIILVDACRSVGVPARIAGTALWANKRGNHTWVEIYDDGKWYFTGADEYDAKGLNRGWFTKDAGQAKADHWKHAIWATSWKKTGNYFPMVWDLKNKEVSAVNVTARYAKEQKAESEKIFVRLWDKKDGKRIVGRITLLDSDANALRAISSKAGTSDLNDMPHFEVVEGLSYYLVITHEGDHRSLPLKQITPGQTLDLHWDKLEIKDAVHLAISTWMHLLPEERHLSIPQMPLSESDTHMAVQLILDPLIKERVEERKNEVEKKVVKAAGKEIKYLERVFGDAPYTERSLWISLHGGGGAPPEVNDQQWRNQIQLYQPKEGIYIAPRAPTDTWNLWHEGHIDDLLARLIENMVTVRGVNPNKVYLMGYSAGGDGVYQLAPRMADRFAAAAMMAGHPNDANPLGLRNLPFMIFMGGDDAAYDRNKVAAKWGVKLDELQKDDPKGYDHKTTIYEGLGHWMKRKDAEALPWMAKRERNPWPRKIVWHQSGRTHDRFYWLAMPEGTAKKGQTIWAEVEGQTIRITADDVNALDLRLNDFLINLDQEITVIVNGEETFKGKVNRTTEAIYYSMLERFDLSSYATAILKLEF